MVARKLLAWSAALARRAGGNPAAALAAAFVLAALVAALDYATGYELRFAVLYLFPIAVATWTGGLRAGALMVGISGLFWLASFRSTHRYSGEIFFYWEGVVMVAVYITFVLLLTRLRVALTRADERFVRVLDELHSAVYVTDQDSDRILYANQSLSRLIEADPRTLGAAALHERFGLGDAAVDATQHGRDESPATGFVSREVRARRGGRWYLVQVGPIPWKSGRTVSLQVITDISEQKHAQALKRQHQDILHQTARVTALAEIASSLAHEVNQPLMAIASYNDACLRVLGATHFDKNDLVTALQRCREQALRAGRIIGRVRDFIRSRRPTPGRCDVNALVRESLELLEAQLEDKAVTIDVSLPGDLPMTHADQTLLVQVIVNLVQNAIDAMEQCAPSDRRLSLQTATAPDGAIVVSVSDRGAGIPEGVVDQIFTPLITTKARGLGLGLSICRSVVEAHGGRIWHSANPEGGCSFHFSLPAENV